MGLQHGVVEKKRLRVASCDVRMDGCDHFVAKPGVGFLVHEPRRQIAGRVGQPSIDILRLGARNESGRHDFRAPIANVKVGAGTHRRVHPEKGIEPMIERTAGERFRQIEDRASVFRWSQLEAEVPLADHPGGIPLFLQQFGDGQFLRFQDGAEAVDAVNYPTARRSNSGQ